MAHHQSRHGRGAHDDASPRRIQRFLEPCLLLLLHCTEGHGYEVIEGLAPFGFDENPVDLSTVYRLLRDLEDRGLVTSRWDTDSGGPARRLYLITPEGDDYLASWVGDLRETDRVLHFFLETYDTHM
ncbi:MAG: helix-turn-helix transcriptional regulator, partial [Anaerolineae bacterium]